MLGTKVKIENQSNIFFIENVTLSIAKTHWSIDVLGNGNKLLFKSLQLTVYLSKHTVQILIL